MTKKNLNKLLTTGKPIFKLVCGAGNECAKEVERLVALYSLAGSQMFDISANPEILEATKRGLRYSDTMSDRYICVSVGIKGDPHILKAKINEDKCQQCGQCDYICINDAVKNHTVQTERCLGCGKCFNICPAKAIEMYSVDKDFDLVLPKLVDGGIDCVEFHATVEDDEEIFEKWDSISRNFDGVLSICIDRMCLGNKQVLNRIKKLIKNRQDFTTIIQADGIPMSGSKDDFKTTLQAVAMGEIIMNANLPVYVFLSGGTNSKTTELAKLCGVKYDGVSVGSYARKIVSEYIKRDDFFENKLIFNEALKKAKTLVDSVVKF